MESDSLYILVLEKNGDIKNWDFESREDAVEVYNAIINAFGEYEYKDDGSRVRSSDITQLKFLTPYMGRPLRNKMADFAANKWYTKDAFPKILKWIEEKNEK